MLPLTRTVPVLAAALVLAAPAGAVTGAKEGESPDTASLAGRLLVATQKMPDPRFANTVIYMVSHDTRGAMGLVVNRVVGRGPLSEVLLELGVEAPDAEGEIDIHYGGPVESYRAFVLHSEEYSTDGTIAVDDDISMTSQPEVLADMAAGKGPEQAILALGYAGWGAGQLESELLTDSWAVVPGDPTLVFDSDQESKWRRALDRRGVDL